MELQQGDSVDLGERLTLSIPEAAQRCGVSERTLYKLASEGAFPALRFGRRITVPRVALQAWIDARTTGVGQ